MSTGNISLDILLNQIRTDAIAKTEDSVQSILKRYPSLSKKEAAEIHRMVSTVLTEQHDETALVVTAPPSFSINNKVTKVVVDDMLSRAQRSILITGYSLSDYFSDMIELLIHKSQQGVFVKFFVNNIESQKCFDRLIKYQGRFLEIYNYPKQQDSMSALHAKVISVDQNETLITSANLSYHGQEGNIELGTHIVSKSISAQVEQLFTQLIFSKGGRFNTDIVINLYYLRIIRI